jgi:serine protease AprX
VHVGRTYHSIEGFAGSMTARQARALARRPGVSRIELNGQVSVMDASGDNDYGVTAARNAGAATDGTLDGSGIGICVIDTGIDPNHEQLAGRIVGWKDWVNDGVTPYDDHGHGTHVSGIAAGRPTSGANAAYGGVAPGASLIGAKVLAANGFGEDADVVSAIEWCAARSDVDVISMSLGSPGSDGSDAGSQAAEAAVAAGKVVVAAAGNDGDAPGTISSPGVATDVITVGAASDSSALAGATDTDTGIYLAGFSSRGPTTNPAAPMKPDVVAPGISVVAAKAGTTSSYTTKSGTSMATPFVSGVVALGLEADPAATPGQVKQALRSSAHDAGAPGPDNEWGAGLVDARSFLAALGVAGPGAGPVQDHQLIQGTVASGATQSFPIAVNSSGKPLAVTLHITSGQARCVFPFGGSCLSWEWSPDLDAYLVNPSGTVVANSRCMLSASNGNCAGAGRSETLSTAAAAAGTWTLRVESSSGGAGTFQAGVLGSLGEPPPPPPPPAAPTGLTASATSATSVALAWHDESSDETGFAVERCSGTGCSAFVPVVTLPAGTTAYDDTGLAAGTTYSYRVRALNDGGPSGWSNTDTVSIPALPAPPTAPTGLTVTSLAYNRVDLRWTDTSSNEAGFKVYRCTGKFSCATFTLVATLPADATTATDTTVSPSSYYGYRVDAYNAGGTASTAVLKVTTPAAPPPPVPSAPTGLTATAQSEGAIGLAWTDSSSDETSFAIERCQGAGCTSFAALVTLPAGSTSYDDGGLDAGTSYSYRVKAVNANGSSGWSNTATTSTLPSTSIPSAPSGLTARAVAPSRVDLLWTDTSALETGFRVYRCTGKYTCTSFTLLATLPADTTAWSDLTTAGNTVYGYKVEAFNPSGAASTGTVKVTTPKR